MTDHAPRSDNRIVHVGVCVTDLDRAARWYADMFGFAETKRFRKEVFEIEGVVMELGGMTIEILAPFSPDVVPPPPLSPAAQFRKLGVNHIAITVPDLADCYKKLAVSGGGTLISPVIENRFFFCADPDGTVWEVKQS